MRAQRSLAERRRDGRLRGLPDVAVTPVAGEFVGQIQRNRQWKDVNAAVLLLGALDAGAAGINDISGGSPEMFELVAEAGCGYVLMHIEGPPRVDRAPRRYEAAGWSEVGLGAVGTE